MTPEELKSLLDMPTADRAAWLTQESQESLDCLTRLFHECSAQAAANVLLAYTVKPCDTTRYLAECVRFVNGLILRDHYSKAGNAAPAKGDA